MSHNYRSEPIYPEVAPSVRGVPYQHDCHYSFKAMCNSLHRVLPLVIHFSPTRSHDEIHQWLSANIGSEMFVHFQCKTSIGRFKFNRAGKWQMMYPRVYFVEERDLMLFKLAFL